MKTMNACHRRLYEAGQTPLLDKPSDWYIKQWLRAKGNKTNWHYIHPRIQKDIEWMLIDWYKNENNFWNNWFDINGDQTTEQDIFDFLTKDVYPHSDDSLMKSATSPEMVILLCKLYRPTEPNNIRFWLEEIFGFDKDSYMQRQQHTGQRLFKYFADKYPEWELENIRIRREE